LTYVDNISKVFILVQQCVWLFTPSLLWWCYCGVRKIIWTHEYCFVYPNVSAGTTDLWSNLENGCKILVNMCNCASVVLRHVFLLYMQVWAELWRSDGVWRCWSQQRKNCGKVLYFLIYCFVMIIGMHIPSEFCYKCFY